MNSRDTKSTSKMTLATVMNPLNNITQCKKTKTPRLQVYSLHACSHLIDLLVHNTHVDCRGVHFKRSSKQSNRISHVHNLPQSFIPENLLMSLKNGTDFEILP